MLKILIVTDDIWNDKIQGNNILQNWFEGMEDIEVAQIGCLPIKPYNKVCKKYFQITDSDMLKSLFGRKAGHAFDMDFSEMEENPQAKNYIEVSKFYSFMKKISGTPVRLVRETLWCIGRYNKKKLKQFISDFNPDIVFCPHYLTWKLMRLEKIIRRMTDVPFVAWTGDDESSLRQFSYSPIFWINRIIFNLAFKHHTKIYSHYFTFSETQANDYSRKYNISTSTLYKSGKFDSLSYPKKVNEPIKLVYAGHIYCNRWKTLAEIGRALEKINENKVKMELDIYTQDILTNKQIKFLNSKYINLKGSVSPKQLDSIYKAADIALHVESFDIKNRLTTRLSFSTKIIDLMSSSCAIVAICWKEHTGFQYLKTNDAAICISSYQDILPILSDISKNPDIIKEYADKAYECGKKNHNKKEIQRSIKELFLQLKS